MVYSYFLGLGGLISTSLISIPSGLKTKAEQIQIQDLKLAPQWPSQFMDDDFSFKFVNTV